MIRDEVVPFYFGEPGELFGCYHVPHGAVRRDCAVVLCPSLGHEYIRFHRAYRQLAHRLASTGFAVLRFDYYGCGDSLGHSGEGDTHRWSCDVSMAIEEARQRSGMTDICLIGLRLGGALAVLVGSERQDIRGMVLWDPVVTGKAYLDDLALLHQHMLSQAHVMPRATGGDTELLGVPFPGGLLADLERLDIRPLQGKPAADLLLVDSRSDGSLGSLVQELSQMGVHVIYQQVPSPEIWGWVASVSKLVVPHQIVQSIVSWMCEAYP